jgi:hypothetical protein
MAYAPVLAIFGGALLPVNAHADNWFDNMFTFRTDQKPLVQPRKATPPKMVYQPYYPAQAHTSWSNFYTRADLVPQDYLSSSASKVMREAPPQNTTDGGNADNGGWPAIAERARQNAMQESANNPDNLMIGEPGQGWGMANGDAQIGRATQIGNAVRSWNDDGSEVMPSRPGDYDYHLAAPPAPNSAYDSRNIAATGGTVVDDSGSAQPTGTVEFSTAGSDPRYTKYDAQGRVVQYKVQKGDTLGGISGQEAIYNNWKLWPLIYSANRRAIGGSPNNLTIEQKLAIPRDYTAAQAKDAERKSGK